MWKLDIVYRYILRDPKRFEDDDEVSELANKLSDDEISVNDRETNCRMILRKLDEYFESTGRPYSSLPEWALEPSEIGSHKNSNACFACPSQPSHYSVIDRDADAIAKLLIIVLTAAILCGRREGSLHFGTCAANCLTKFQCPRCSTRPESRKGVILAI